MIQNNAPLLMIYKVNPGQSFPEAVKSPDNKIKMKDFSGPFKTKQPAAYSAERLILKRIRSM